MTTLDPAPERSTAAPADRDWPSWANRWTQLTFTEDDPLHFDPDFWLDVMRRSHSNATCLSAGGYMAFYPTRIPFHYRSKHLGNGDLFGTLAQGAKKMGMAVMARIDPHAIHADALAAHPEWAALDENGAPVEHWAFPGTYITCPFSTYNSDFLTDVAREITREYDIDAVFANRWQGHGISYSPAAARAFREDTGLDLPRGAFDPDDPAWRAWPTWRRQRLSALVGLWDDAVRAVKPHVRFIPNLGSIAAHDLDRQLVEKHYPLLFIDKQGRSGTEAPWAAGRNGKRSRSVFRDRPVGLITSIGPEHPAHRWKDSVTSGPEFVTWIVDGFAQGAFPWFTKFKAEVLDTRWVEPLIDAFTLHARLEPVLSRLEITAEVALLDATRSSTLPTHGKEQEDGQGAYQALVEAGIPFELVCDGLITAEQLDRFRVLLAPNVQRLSEQECRTIAEWVARGGALVAACETSLLTEDGARREDLGLADLLGVHLTGPVRQSVRNNYVALVGEHPLHAGFTGAQRIIGGTQVVPVQAADDTTVPLRFVPDYPDLPMEEVYAREAPRDPAVVLREHDGGGRSAYVAFNLGSIFWEALQPDHGRLLADTVRWALGGHTSVQVDTPGIVDVSVYRTPRGSALSEVAVCLVNLTNPMTMRGAIRRTLPSGPVSVSVPVPAGADVTSARLVLDGSDVAVNVSDGTAEVIVPCIDLLEVLHLTFAPSSTREKS
ncbi:family 10 glycosylhydrolase [Kineococcus arenarius]|uniref:family 10 glycosylhydrolase n=1 Tax=Kineococcus sp. SYSU DK007 TaxID=3383128 RepID=UPI003D7D3FA7